MSGLPPHRSAARGCGTADSIREADELLLREFAHRTKNNLQSRGTRVMQLLVEQLRGTMERQDADPGCMVIVEMMVCGEDAL